MSYLFFHETLKFLGKRLNYDAVSNLTGNSFAKNAMKIIQENNPLVKKVSGHAFTDMFNEIKVEQEDSMAKALPRVDWLSMDDVKNGIDNNVNEEGKNDETE